MIAIMAGAIAATAAAAQDAAPAPSDPPAAAPASSSRDIVVTARRLDDARASIQPSLGATSYAITNATIQALPGGDTQHFNQLVLTLP